MENRSGERNGARVHVRMSVEVVKYLDQLAAIGIHGKTRAEVAKTLIGNEVERLVREGILTLRERSDF